MLKMFLFSKIFLFRTKTDRRSMKINSQKIDW